MNGSPIDPIGLTAALISHLNLINDISILNDGLVVAHFRRQPRADVAERFRIDNECSDQRDQREDGKHDRYHTHDLTY